VVQLTISNQPFVPQGRGCCLQAVKVSIPVAYRQHQGAAACFPTLATIRKQQAVTTISINLQVSRGYSYFIFQRALRARSLCPDT